MSTISVSGLSTLYQSGSTTLAPQVQAPDSDDTTVGATPDATDASHQQGVQGHHHHHGGGGGQFFSKLQSAVTSALQAAQSDGTTDPNQAIQNAIESVLKAQDGTTTGSSTDGSTTPTPAASGTDGSAAVDPQAARQAFFQTLQSYGVNAQQFQQDFLAAFQDAKNGNADPSSVFQSLPPGSVVDTTG